VVELASVVVCRCAGVLVSGLMVYIALSLFGAGMFGGGEALIVLGPVMAVLRWAEAAPFGLGRGVEGGFAGVRIVLEGRGGYGWGWGCTRGAVMVVVVREMVLLMMVMMGYWLVRRMVMVMVW